MDESRATALDRESRRTRRPRPRPVPLASSPEAPGPSPLGVWVVAFGFGLATGLLELVGLLVWRSLAGETARLGTSVLNRHFVWMTPASSALVFGLLGVLLGLACRLSPRRGWRAVCYILSTLMPLTLLLAIRPLHPAASLTLAMGIAVHLAPRVQSWVRTGHWLTWRGVPALLLVLVGLAGFSFGREALREHLARRHRPAARSDAPNILLIVIDTARADALTPYGARRDTTPVLARLAREGVRFEHARSTAPWTLPSHASMFTGRYPFEVGVGMTRPLDATYPTLAEHLAAQGYATGGFVANFVFGNEAYGLDRGFQHYENRPVSLDDILGCSGLGRRVDPAFDQVRSAWSVWTRGVPWYNPIEPLYRTQRVSAGDIRRSFLRWSKGVEREGRPFFAFLNLLDAHAPYVLPQSKDAHHFGRHIESTADYQVLRDWTEERDRDNWKHDRAGLVSDDARALARDSYDDCLAALDRELGRLFAQLDRRGSLRNTLIVVTSDHGEAFGEHDIYLHGVTLFQPEVRVPLLFAWREHLPQGHVVAEPVSLRDLPATLVDLAGCVSGAPFPGRSLARCWSDIATPAEPSEAPMLLSELPELGTQSLQQGTKVYIRYKDGSEQLFDLATDPAESVNLATSPQSAADLERFRKALVALSRSL